MSNKEIGRYDIISLTPAPLFGKCPKFCSFLIFFEAFVSKVISLIHIKSIYEFMASL